MADVINNWPRRKRRASNGSKSPSFDPVLDQSPSRGQANSGIGDGLLLKGKSVEVDTVTGASSVKGCRKRVLQLQSEADRASSPSKQRKTDVISGGAISEPVLFSEDAMDGSNFFSNDSVFVGPASDCDEDLFASPRRGRSQTAGRNASPQIKAKNMKKLSFSRTSSFNFEGSQGFEITSVSRGSSSYTPSSPAVKTRPVSLSHDLSDGSLSSCFELDKNTHDKKDKKKTNKRKRGTCSPEDPPDVSSSSVGRTAGFQPSLVNSQLTPLRVKGTRTSLSVSPSVTTRSLVHLINSPLLMGDSELAQSNLSESEASDHERRHSTRKRARYN
jgi:hypothetical protein